MIDLEAVDKLYERSQSGPGVVFGLFDRSMLLPLEQLPDAVAGETGESASLDELRARAADGWFDVLHSEHLADGQGGVPLYIPSRIGLFLKLARAGWTTVELRLVARSEEWLIDEVLAADELAYCEDDLDSLILFTRGRIDSLQDGVARDGAGNVIDQSAELADERETLSVFETMRRSGIPDHLAARVRRDAFRVRAMNDCIRVWLLNEKRARYEADYSPLVCFRETMYDRGRFSGEIEWDWTIQSAMAENEADEAPVRVPGFLLHGGGVTTTRTLRPREYAEHWRELKLDGYLEAWARLHEERRCKNCHHDLPDGSDPRRQFCGEKCRNAVRQRRYRKNHPEAIERAQSRYWRSLDLEEGES
jgi:hypothetical protein